ncbi:hypothetical protein ABXJ76_04200 [Methylobacter sp. G7]|uniref:hypothetical protein n=1 Tax=Methylobacter sp. G7 TaxID=3230117 RepID=UPI003D80120A
MNNQDLSHLPVIERLTAARKLQSPVLDTKKKPSKVILERLNPNSPTDRLTAARMGHVLKPVQPKQAEEVAGAGGFFDGIGFVSFD